MNIRVKITIGVYKDKNLKEIFIEWTPEKFTQVLEQYSKNKTVPEAMEVIKKDLEQEITLK